MTAARKLTPARKRGLAALAAVHPTPGRRSNETWAPAGHVYWQTADWLVANGLATLTGHYELRLTPEGRLLAALRS